MGTNGQDLLNLIKGGNISPESLRQALGATTVSTVTVEGWGVCYSEATGQLSEYCTVVANSPNNPITGVGLIAYTSDATSMLCLQYTNEISSPIVATSVGTTQYNPQSGNEILCIVYGWTD